MSEQFSNHCPVSVANTKNVYKAITGKFTVYLKERGHSFSTRHAYQSALRHFVRWLTEESSERRAIDNRSVYTFLYEHLPVCCCPPPIFKELRTTRAALHQLLLMQGYSRPLPSTSKGSVAVERSLHQFDDYLQDVCGLTESTRLNRKRQVRIFLVDLFGSKPINPLKITPDILLEFITIKATKLKPSSVGVLLSSRFYVFFMFLPVSVFSLK